MMHNAHRSYRTYLHRNAAIGVKRRSTMLLWLLLAYTATSAAASLDEPSQLRLPAGSVRSALGASVRVYGLPLRAETFQSPTDLVTTVDAIARQLDAPPALLVQTGALLVTWQSGRYHWVARLTQPHDSHTHGTISVLTLPVEYASQPGDSLTSVSLPTWLPSHARLLFTLSDTGSGGNKALRQHSVYHHDWPPFRLRSHLQERLHRAGWQREVGVVADSGALPESGALHYTRGSQRLTLIVVAASGGSGVLVFETRP